MCRRMRGALQVRQISDKFILRHDSLSSGLFSSIGVDILGPYRYRVGPNTRSNKMHKAWVLLICCQFTSAVNSIVMEDYSSTSFLKAYDTHVVQFHKPLFITCDSGSQLKAVATRTRSKASQELPNSENLEDQGKSFSDIFDRIKSTLKGVRFFVAPSGAQFENGLVESNFRELKMILKKLTCQFGADNVRFRSSFELDRLFKKACGLLNSRPIFYNDTEFVSVKSLTCPGFGSDRKRFYQKMTLIFKPS